MKKQIVRLTEGDLHRIIKESVNNILNEAKDPLMVIKPLIQQANDSVMQAKQYCDGDEYPLMDKEGNTYGLKGEIILDGRGYIVFPFIDVYSNYSSVEKIKVLQKIKGIVTLIKGDYFNEGWIDAKKMLKKIINDAQRGIEYFKGYDSSWENSESNDDFRGNIENLKQFNKRIGRKSNTGLEYLNKP